MSYTNVNQILPSFDYSYTMSLLSERIRRVKREMGWSNAELARRAGTSRTAPTDWLKDTVTHLSSAVASNLSRQTPFCATWLATGEGPVHKSDATTNEPWPFTAFTKEKFDSLPERVQGRVEQAALAVIQEWEQSKSPIASNS
ncbi:MAG: helix-turn-helix transcriptional regulator [Pusillimonas sp.]|nr:helix-turn-helix transcriptional regulator [Pusillimonas sp.]